VLDSDPQLGLILAKDAVETKDTAEAVRALRESLGASHLRGEGVAPRPLDGAALSADGSEGVALDDRGRACVWRVPAGGTGARDPIGTGNLADVPGGKRWLDAYGRRATAARAIRRRPTVDSSGSVISADFTGEDAAGDYLAPSASGRHGFATSCVETYLTLPE